MRPEIWAAGVATLLATATPVIRLLVGLWRHSFAARRWSPADRVALAVAAVVLAALFLRPHRDTFQALDCSAFRNMARAFIAGRGFHDRDAALEELPLELRRWTLMHSGAFEGGERPTRDRSFQLDSLETPTTRPYFYPLLPLAMAAIGAVGGIAAGDFFVPIVSLAFWFGMALFMGAGAGWRGVLLSAALALASPLPAWLGRGAHLEAVSAALLGVAALHWFSLPAGKPANPASFFAVGLAVSYHPLMILPALPIGLGLLTTCGVRRERATAAIAGLIGVVPLFVLTAAVCAPYGALNWPAIRGALVHNPFIRPAAVVFALLMAAVAVALSVRSPAEWWARLPPIRWPLAFMLLAGCVAPTLVLRLGGAGASLAGSVSQGFREWLDGLQLPMSLLLVLLSVIAVRQPGAERERWLLLAVGLTLPAFLHVKGLEPMGLWSQRRLLVSWQLGVLALGAAASAWMAADLSRRGFARVFQVVLPVAGLLAGLHNPIRWPAPYLTQFDRGADELVEAMEQDLNGAMSFFEYHTHSLPFAVLPGRRAFGLNENAAAALPSFAAWIRQRCATEPVLWVAASGNPGIEDGVRLVTLREHLAILDRARSRSALPAERRPSELRLQILRAEPLAAGDEAALDISFDADARNLNRPRLALRGPWGRGGIRIKDSDGGIRTGRWTRVASAVIGPVPRSGGAVRVTIEGGAARDDGRDHQILSVIPPWNGPALDLRFGNGLTRAEGVLRRPSDSESNSDVTGPYRLEPRWPYNPADAGIRGFDPDLGILICRIRLETPAPEPADSARP